MYFLRLSFILKFCVFLIDNTAIFYLFRKTTEIQLHFLKKSAFFSGLHIVNTADIDFC